VLMLDHLGWNEAAKLIMASMEKTIASKVVTYDFARLMDGAKEVKCSAVADDLIKNL
ncbi:MAG TPA: isocitrate/isopropylmalate family dehydrogenase, partial [Planococcus sp. (in: firmicutes)]|nr:isocitrate/isopropylmalate family dehydrogenase [Planococcus sp. (in: firmicutes)]